MRAAAFMTRRALCTGLAFLVVLSGGQVALAQTPDFTGVWQLDPKRSEDAKAKVASVVGGAHTVGSDAKERERVNLRNWLLPTVERLDRFEVAQSAQEIKVVGGNEDDPRVRIFRFDGERTRIGEAGVKFKYKTKWEGPVLTIEEEAEKGKGKIIDTLAFEADGKSLVHTIRFDARGLKEPLDLRLVYTRIR
jgi:hypothetical protein